jgi:hypothetical protein
MEEASIFYETNKLFYDSWTAYDKVFIYAFRILAFQLPFDVDKLRIMI